ncbi:MAG TPA: hypothetical protein VF552_01835 [Allosphingosinicella sp.]|jgi:peptidoglycan/LPS O-acetylase OafA/YrhL
MAQETRPRRLPALAVALAVSAAIACAANFLVQRVAPAGNWSLDVQSLPLVILWIAAPFLLLALLRAGRAPWVVALVLTLTLWIFFLAVAAGIPPNQGGELGLGLLMILSPPFIILPALALHLWQRWRARRA